MKIDRTTEEAIALYECDIKWFEEQHARARTPEGRRNCEEKIERAKKKVEELKRLALKVDEAAEKIGLGKGALAEAAKCIERGDHLAAQPAPEGGET